MPVDYEIDPARCLIRTRCHGEVRFDQITSHFRTLADDPKLPSEPDVLLDFSDLTTYPDRDHVRSAALEVRGLLPKVTWGRCAIAAPEDVTFGIARMFEMISEPYFSVVMVFRSHDEAETWLASPRPVPLGRPG